MFDTSLTFASLEFTQSGQPSATNSVTVGGVEYTFQAGAISAAGEVQIGSDAEGSQDNLIAAINGTDGVNTPNPHARAVKNSATVMEVFARLGGTVGNFVTVAEDHANGDWEDAGTELEDGEGDLGDYIEEILDQSQVDSEQYHGLTDALYNR